MKKHPIYTILLLLIGTLSACNNDSKNRHEDTNSACIISPEFKKLIALDSIKTTSINQELELTGSVSYDQDHLYSYQSLVSGVIQKVNFKVGDYVQKGQVLLEISTTELKDQKSELIKLQAELKMSERKLLAAQNLYQDGVASERDLLEAKNDVSSVKAEINRIQETLTLQGGNIETSLIKVKAPSGGYIVEKKVTAGTQIDVGEGDLFVISDLKKLWVQANVYTTQLEKVAVGQQVEVESIAYPNKVFKGKINRLSNIFDEEERVLKAIIEIDNSNLELKPSMMVNVNVFHPTSEQALAIPKHAVIFDHNAYYILQYKTDCEVSVVQIHPAGKDKKYYYIKDDNIRSGDVIISKNQLLIYNQINGR